MNENKERLIIIIILSEKRVIEKCVFNINEWAFRREKKERVNVTSLNYFVNNWNLLKKYL